MSMTCVETAGNDPTSLAEAPLIQILLTMTTALTTVFPGYSDIFASQRSPPSLLLTIEEVQVFECVVSIHTLVSFMSRLSSTSTHGNVTSPLLHAPSDLRLHQSLIATGVKTYMSASQSTCSLFTMASL